MNEAKQENTEKMAIDYLLSLESFTSNDCAYIVYRDDAVGTENILSLDDQTTVDWLLMHFYKTHGKILRSGQLHNALSIVRSSTRLNGDVRNVYKRFAEHEGSCFLDLCNGKNEVVRVSEHGWQIQSKVPVLFHRTASLESLPEPTHTDISPWDFFEFVNIDNDSVKLQVLVWMTALLRPSIQRPILGITGAPGSAKTTLARLVRLLFDPAVALEVDVPVKDDEFALAFHHNPVPLFDNISKLNRMTSDMFCKAVTGGAFTKRRLYTDLEQTQVRYQRPIIITSLEVPSAMPDFLRRMMSVELEPIDFAQRKSEREIMADFERQRPQLLGSLLNLTSDALRTLPLVKLGASSTLVDFDRWGVAVAKALGIDPRQFLESRMRAHSVQRTTDNKWSQVAYAVEDFAKAHPGWEGTMTQLYNALLPYREEQSDWPVSATSLGKARNSINELLEGSGVQIQRGGKKNHESIIRLNVACQAEDVEMTSAEEFNVELDSDSDIMQPRKSASTKCFVLLEPAETDWTEDEIKYSDEEIGAHTVFVPFFPGKQDIACISEKTETEDHSKEGNEDEYEDDEYNYKSVF